MELFKLLAAKDAVEALAVMTEAGLLDPVLAGVPLLATFSNTVKSKPRLDCRPIRSSARRARRFGLEDADRLRDRLRIANVEHERLARWRRLVACFSGMGRATAHALLYRLGPARFTDRVLLAWARPPEGAADPHLACACDAACALERPAFPLRAADFITRGLPKGPRLGAALAAAEEAGPPRTSRAMRPRLPRLRCAAPGAR